MTKNQKHILLFPLIILASMLACGYQNVVKYNGYSMEPTITDGQKLFIESVDPSDLKRGDIIYFELGNAQLIKRVVGLPGEKIEIRDGNIYINDQILVEAYKASAPNYIVEPITLDTDQYFVLGDNRNDSKDSHQFGPINSDQITGKILDVK